MANGTDMMREMASNMWDGYFRYKVREMLRTSVSFFRAQVVTAPANGLIGVQEPFDAVQELPYTPQASGLQPGDQCVVLVLGSHTNSIVVGDGKLQSLPQYFDIGNASISPSGVSANGMSVEWWQIVAAASKIQGVVITAQPTDFTGQVGDTATFTVVATGDGLSYQWQWLNSQGVWKDQSYTSFKKATLQVGVTAARNGYQYRCVVKDQYNNVAISNPVTMIVSQ